jgi:hypothetical protein
MGRFVACLALVLIVFFSTTPTVRSDTATEGDVFISVEAVGARNVVSEFAAPDNHLGYFHFVYQTSDTAFVTVSLSLGGGEPSWSVESITLVDLGPSGVETPSLTFSDNSVSFTADLRQFNAFQRANGVPMTVAFDFAYSQSGQGPFSSRVYLHFFPDRTFEIVDNVVDNLVFVKIGEIRLTPTATDPDVNPYGVVVENRAVLGENVSPTSLSGNFSFLPESQTLSLYNDATTFSAATFVVIANPPPSPLFSGAAGNRLPSFLPTASILRLGSDGSQLTDSVNIGVGGKNAGAGTIQRYFAVVEEVNGDVTVKPPLGGEYVPVNLNDKLTPGAMLRLRKSSDRSGNIFFPSLRLTFYDATKAEISVVGSFQNDPNEALYVQVGQTGISGTSPCDLITDTKNFVRGVAAEPREFARVAVKKGFGTLAKLATGGFGFIYSTLGGQAVEHVVNAADESSRPKRSALYSGPVGTAWSGENATAFEVSLTDQGSVLYNRGTMLHIEYGTPTAGGGFVSSGISTNAPERSYLTLDPAGTFSALKPLYPQTAIPLVPIEISEPAPTSTVNSLYSCLTVKYGASWLSDASVPIVNSLSVRLNRVLVSPFMYPSPDYSTAQYCPPGDRPLIAGLNSVKAAISTYKAGRAFTASSFYASAGNPTAPRGLVPYSGKTHVILKWDPNIESTVTKYRVLTAASADKSVAAGLVAETSQTVYVLNTAAATGFYSIQACSGDLCSEESARVRVNLNPSLSVATPVISACNGTASEHTARLKITPGVPAPVAWKCYQRNSTEGLWTNVLGSEGALTASDTFTVNGLTNGATYYFKAVPVGLDLVEGSAQLTLPLTPQDVAPAPPLGASVEFVLGGALVEWNPSPEADLAGYNLYRSDDNGSFTLVNIWGLLTDPSYTDWVLTEHFYAWKITAVDTAGHEGQPAAVVYGSTWGLGSGDGGGRKIFLPLILNNFSQ